MSETDLDVAAALDAVGGDAELLAQVMQVFLQTAPPLWVNLASCAANIEQILRQPQGAGWRHLQPQLLQLGEQVQVCVSGYLSKR